MSHVVEQTRIRRQYLEALEADHYDQLPGQFFVRSFALQYAECLGLNPEEVQLALHRTAPAVEFSNFRHDEPALPSIRVPERPSVDPLPEGTASMLNAKKLASSVAMLLGVVVVCSLFFWLWQRAQISSSAAGTAAEQRRPAASPLASNTVSPPVVQPLAPKEQPKPAPAVTQTAAATPSRDDQPAANPAGDPNAGKINLVLTARDNVWVRITADNKVIMEGLLTSGQSQSAAANQNVRVLAGNAGDLDIRFNGSNIGALGQRGQVRTIEFTPERFMFVEQPSNADASTDPPPAPQRSSYPPAQQPALE